MAAFLIVRLPSRLKSLEAVEYMQRNHFSFRISSNFSLLNLLTSSEGTDGGLTAALCPLNEFKLGDEEKQLIQQFSVTEVKEEVDSGDEYQPKNNVNATEVKEEVESDDEQEDVRTTKEGSSHGKEAFASQQQSIVASQVQPAVVTSTVTEQGIEEAELEVEEHEEQNILGEKEKDEQRMERGDDREMTVDDVLDSADAGNSMMSVDPIHNDDSLVFDAALDEEFLEQEKAHSTKTIEQVEEEVVDDEIEDNGNVEEFEEVEEELVEEQEHEGKEDCDEEEDEDSTVGDDAKSDEESAQEGKDGRLSGGPVERLLFTCPVKNCPSSYKTFQELEEHMKIHPDKQDFFCDVCKSNFTSKVTAMEHIGQREKKNCCSCGKKFTKASRLLQHIRCHTGEKPFVCTICDQGFSWNSVLKSHMDTHTGEKRFSCSFCKKRFTQKGTLKRHEMTHTGEKPFSCGHCEKRFTHKHHLQVHELTHSGEKPFECKDCGKRFRDRSGFNKHIRIHTGEKPYSCKECYKKFNESGHKSQHQT